VTGALTALLGGGAARFFLRHHPMFSINSLCGLFGKQDCDRADGPRDLAFAIWGEAWHNTHQAFPIFSGQGADGRQIDLSVQFIELIEKLGSLTT
jgi:stearoyl-CoA desaturase (Delta-9 desaturase)